MEFNVDATKTPNMPAVLGINHVRSEKILDFVEEMVYAIRSNIVTKKLTTHYKELAEFCNTIEEYAFAMHNLIFNLANIGRPADSQEKVN